MKDKIDSKITCMCCDTVISESGAKDVRECLCDEIKKEMAKRNTLKQEYYKTTSYYYWKDKEGKPTIEYVNWLEDKLLNKLK